MQPSRRQFLHTLAGPVLLGAADDRRPNVLYVFSDQHRACSMTGQEFYPVSTPALNSLAAEGVSVANCISNYPVCSPYRGILLSGRWPYQTGIIDNDRPLKESEVSLGRTFHAAGYHTGYVGKWHLDAKGTEGAGLKPEGAARHGFDEWRAWYNTNPHFDKSYTFDSKTGRKLAPKGYNATLMADDAIGFIQRNQARPWMLVLSWNPPHPPFLDAPPELMKKYEPAGLKFRPNVGRPVKHGAGVMEESLIRQSLGGYYAHIEAVDREFGRLLAALRSSGQLDNTIIIYTSDHGEMLGASGRMGKRLPHDESCRVPFLVRHPKTIPSGRTSDALLSTIDIYPTLCGLAGIQAPAHCAGRDMSAALRGERADGPESAFLMHIDKAHTGPGVNHPAPLFRGVRTKRYTYAVGEIGRWCLYDDREDPYQQYNLVDDHARRSLISDLDGEILRFLEQAEDNYPFQTLRARRTISSGRRPAES